MHRRNRGDDRNLRPSQARQRRDFALVVHAHFEDRVMRARWTTRQRQRYAPMIVVGRDRGMRLAIFGQRKTQRFLGSGLADRTGDADHFARQSCASGYGEVPQSC